MSTIFFVGLTTGLKLLRKDIRHRLELQELQAQQLRTELHLLKSQINPHFLFNTLNNLFSMARKQNPGTADGIAHLSHLMRYMIYDSTGEKIELEKELQQISRIIELQKLRFAPDDPISIDFRIEGNPATIQIPPLILIPFVENAFKHGLSIESASFISILLSIRDRQLVFNVRNSLHTRQPSEEGKYNGLGLQNVRRQLEILYPHAHELLIQQDEKEYHVQLTIDAP